MATAAELSGALPGYFKISDLKGQGSVVYTVVFSGEREVGKDRESKPVLEFAETRKALVLNGTRISQLIGIFGDKDLQGVKISLSVRDEMVNGKKFEMICVDSAA